MTSTTPDIQFPTKLMNVVPIDPAELANDSAVLLSELCELLAELDQMREAVEQINFIREPSRVLAGICTLADRIVEFGEQRFWVLVQPPRLAEVAREFHNLTAKLLGGARAKGFLGMGSRTILTTNLDEFIQSINLFHELMFLHFEFFTTAIPDRWSARVWVESAAVFCVDIRRLLKSFPLV